MIQTNHKYLIDSITYNDWFLPSIDALNAMLIELHDHSVGNFVEDYYWSSSEYSITHAYLQIFWTGFPISQSSKGGVNHVRACRTFISTTNYNLRDIGPAGGWIFWKSGNNYLECAPADQSNVSEWSNIVDQEIGTTGIAIGTGQTNTTAIINQDGHINSAAKLCADLIIMK